MRTNQIAAARGRRRRVGCDALLSLLEQRKQQAQDGGQVFLDRRRDDALDAGSPLHPLDSLVERRQRDDRLARVESSTCSSSRSL